MTMRQLLFGTRTDICRTILATYYKVGVYNVLEREFPAVIEIDEN